MAVYDESCGESGFSTKWWIGAEVINTDEEISKLDGTTVTMTCEWFRSDDNGGWETSSTVYPFSFTIKSGQKTYVTSQFSKPNKTNLSGQPEGWNSNKFQATEVQINNNTHKLGRVNSFKNFGNCVVPINYPDLYNTMP